MKYLLQITEEQHKQLKTNAARLGYKSIKDFIIEKCIKRSGNNE